MYSDDDDLLTQAGFPHSEILGSMLVCQLPEAYRKLLRPSSPVAAKASTVCAYSLDHITPNGLYEYFPLRAISIMIADIPNNRPYGLSAPSFTTFQIVKEHARIKHIQTKKQIVALLRSNRRTAPPSIDNETSKARHMHAFQKNFSYTQQDIGTHHRHGQQYTQARWWSQAGSNRRPPACKADALPAELWPQAFPTALFSAPPRKHTEVLELERKQSDMRKVVGLGGVEPPTSPLSGVRSNLLSYRPLFGISARRACPVILIR